MNVCNSHVEKYIFCVNSHSYVKKANRWCKMSSSHVTLFSFQVKLKFTCEKAVFTLRHMHIQIYGGRSKLNLYVVSDCIPPKLQRAQLCFSTHRVPSCTAVKLQPLHPIKRKTTQGFLSSVDTFDITNSRLIVKEKFEENQSKVKKTDCMQVRVSARHAGVYPHYADWCFDRKTHRSAMAVDKAAAWPASVLTALTAFKEQNFFFFSSLFVVR